VNYFAEMLHVEGVIRIIMLDYGKCWIIYAAYYYRMIQVYNMHCWIRHV